MARTMARPSPWPSVCRIRWLPSCWKGWKRRSTSSGGITVPVFFTVMLARPAVVVVAISIQPPAALWRRALSTRFATRLATRFGSPAAGAVASVVPTWMPRRWASWWRARTKFPAMSARSKGSRCSIPRSLLASVSSASMRRSCCSPSASTSWQVDRNVSAVASGSASATWSRVRSAVSGVRSSCEALATKCRCDANDVWSRSNRSSSVAASSLNSSSRPLRLRRRCRLLAEMSRAVAVMVRRGRRNRPAISQPSTSETTTMTASPTAEAVSSWWWWRSVPCGALGLTLPWKPAGTVSLVCRSGMVSRAAPETKKGPA